MFSQTASRFAQIRGWVGRSVLVIRSAVVALVIVVSALIGSVLVGAPAGAADRAGGGGIRAAPDTTENLLRTFRKCESTRVSHPDAVERACMFSYLLQDASPLPMRVRRAEWHQFAVVPPRGKCMTAARGAIGVADGRIDDITAGAAGARGRQTARLQVGRDTASPGNVSKRFSLGVGSLSTRLSQSERTLKWRWRGRTSSKVVLVIGAAMNVPVTSEGTSVAGSTATRVGPCTRRQE